MIELKLQKPYIDKNGNVREKLERHYAEDENGKLYYVRQVETGREYTSAIDVSPCRYTYVATNKEVEKRKGE